MAFIVLKALNNMTPLVYVLLFCVHILQPTIAYYAQSYYQINESEAKALFLTDLIEKGKIAEAKQQASVNHPELQHLKSYAGYITVNKQYNSNLFFWFFLSQTKPTTDPIFLWLNGGPAITVLFAICDYNGPIKVLPSQVLEYREHSFITNHSVIYVDSPLGTGFSFTDNDAGYSRSLDDVTRDIMNFLDQFYALFPEFRKNDFIVGGDSYAGKFAVTVAKSIHESNNKKVNNKRNLISLKGVIIGNGLIDTAIQSNQADYLYSVGLIDFNARDTIKAMENELQQVYYKSYNLNTRTIVDQNVAYQYQYLGYQKFELISQLTGYSFYNNILHDQLEVNVVWFYPWLQRADVRKALHVGSGYAFNLSLDYAKDLLPYDPYAPVKKELEEVLELYKVLIYHGQFDLMFPYPSTVDMIRSCRWSGAQEYSKAPRKIWRVDGSVAGYWKTVKNLNEVAVREAGHLASQDRLKWVNDMITKFTHGISP